VLRRGQASGLSVRQFCREQRVSEASYYNWKRKLAGGGRSADAAALRGVRKPAKKGSAAKPARVLQACRKGTQNDHAAVFIPVRVKAAAGSPSEVVPPQAELLEARRPESRLEVVHPRGCVVRVPAVFDEGALRRVLDVLDRPGDA
jgi:hypothetical protein